MGELGVTPRTVPNRQAQAIGKLNRRSEKMWKDGARAGREDSVYARAMIRPSDDTQNGVVVKSPKSGWGTGAYGTGQAFMLLRNDYSGTPQGGGTATEPDRNVLFRVDRTGGIGTAGGIHVATGLRMNGMTTPTQGIWVQNFVDAVGIVINGKSGQASDLFRAVQGAGFAKWCIGPNGIPMVRSESTGAQTLTNGVPAALTLFTENYDSDTMNDAGGVNLTAPRDGVYRMTGNARFAANGTGVRQLYIFTSTGIVVASVTVPAAVGAVTDLSVSGEYLLSAGQSVSLVATQTSGGNLNVLSGSTTNFSMCYIGG